MEIVRVLAAALAGFAVGAAWYMALSRQWIRAAEIPVDASGRPAGGGSALPFAVSGVAMILVAGMMRYMLESAGVTDPAGSLLRGFGVGAFLIAPWLAMCYAYANRRKELAFLDGGYAVLGCGAIGLVLGLF